MISGVFNAPTTSPLRVKVQTQSADFKDPFTSSQVIALHCSVHQTKTELIVVVCRTIYLHCQICWNLHVTRVALIVLNIIGWVIPAAFLGAAFGVAEITYTISDHCSMRVDWIVDLLIIPIIIEIGCAVVVQITTFIYCVNVYLRSLNEPAPPTNDSFGESAISNSVFSTGSGGRYPYRKAMKRVNKVECPLKVADFRC